MENKNKIPDTVRDYMRTIGKKGGEALRGTPQAKLRSRKAQKARLAKEAKLKALAPVPASPAWIAAVQAYTQEVITKDPVERARFDLLVGRAVIKNDMRALGKFFEYVQRCVENERS
jgi:hypothetical protein